LLSLLLLAIVAQRMLGEAKGLSTESLQAAVRPS
jgi:hypothetical protein